MTKKYDQAGQLTLSTKPVIFGRNVSMACTASSVNEFKSPSRIWNGGKEYGLLVVNGASTNPWKYKENKDSPRKRYILEITDFHTDDGNELYSCTYGFVQYKTNLTINEDVYEYHPNKSEIGVSNYQLDETIVLDLYIHTIFPIPKCYANIM
ncbi:unnamed protein product [Mytilus edulis]|uniref:Uncharacterized protein n=1 Tax=Mytilus edulis TaxID=6550 RepID=A0A8S3PSC8_MYTED|nr:unnamed protein product [Mytilus edulis]